MGQEMARKELREHSRTLAAGSREAVDDTRRLYEEVAGFSMQLSDFVAASDDMLAKAGDAGALGKSADHFSSMYDHMMMMSCMRPLMSGLNARSVLYTAGMMMGYKALHGASPFTGAQETALADAYKPCADELARINDASWRAAGLGQTGILAKAGAAFGQGGRNPLSPEAAAIVSMGLDKQAYLAMRQPGADVDAVRAQHGAAMANLYALAEADGISAAALDANRGRLAARLAGTEFADMYSELVRFPSGPEVGSDGVPTGSWRLGGAEDSFGFGSFSVRAPYDVQSLKDEILAQNMATSASCASFMRQAAHGGAVDTQVAFDAMAFTPEELSQVAKDYRAVLDVLRAGGSLDDPALRAGLSENMNQSLRAFGAAYSADGLSQAECSQAMLTAMNETMAFAAMRQPEMFAEWAETPGGRAHKAWAESIMAGDPRTDSRTVGDDAAGPSWVDDEPIVDFSPGRHGKAPEDDEAGYDEAPAQQDEGPSPQAIVLEAGKAAGRRRRSFNALMKEKAAERLMGDFERDAMADGVVTKEGAREGCELSSELAAAIANPSVGLDGLSL